MTIRRTATRNSPSVSGGQLDNDNRYRDLLPPTVTLTNIDDETAGFMVSTITGNTSENGSTATFTVYLTSQPTDNVTLTLFSDDSSEGEVTPELYRFTTSSWNTPKTFTVTGLNDYIRDGTDLHHQPGADLQRRSSIPVAGSAGHHPGQSG